MHVLVLSIGSNPLPNYVVTDYLLSNTREDLEDLPRPDKIILVHSSKTEKFAKNIVYLLKKKKKVDKNCFSLLSLGKREREGQFIQQKIKDWLEDIVESIESIHLNYTGGTKQMAVHLYHSIDRFRSNHDIKTYYSDLDPEDFKIGVIEGDLYSKYPAEYEKDLRGYVQLSIKELFKLHNMELMNGEKRRKTSVDDIFLFAERAFAAEGRGEYWRKNVSIIKSNNDKADKYKDRDKYKEQYDDVRKVFHNELIPDINSLSRKEFERWIKWLHGEWFEHYVYNVLQEIFKNNSNVELDLSVEAKMDTSSQNCEIDIVILIGYQLFIISCTTDSSKKIVKGKAFEAIYRAEQLGGEHATVIVASFMPKDNGEGRKITVHDLQEDLSSFDTKYNKKCRLLSYDDVSDRGRLEKALREIFEEHHILIN
jgi:hypothetical protein